MKRWLARAAVVLVLALGAGSLGRAEDAIVANSGVQGGFVVHLGCADGELTARLRPSAAYVVHALDTDPAEVARVRERFLAEKCIGPVSAAVFDGEHLPYVDNMVNLLVVSARFNVSDAELMRVLAPGGVLLKRTNTGWSKQIKPVPAELDEWTHYLHDADNNAVSEDAAVAAPLRHLQWQAGPRYSRHHDTASSIPAVVTAGGRLFSIVDEGPRASILWDADWRLIARDAYNGVVLWRRKIDQWTDQLWPLKSGPSTSPRRLVARADAVYATLGLLRPVSKLDAATGKTLQVYAQTEKTEEIILKDGVLYLVINPAVDPRQRGGSWQRAPKIAAAVRESDGAVLWRRELPWIAPVTLTVGDERVFLCDGPTIRALDRGSGRQVWQSQGLPGRAKMPTYFAPTLVAAGDCLLYAGGENWHEHAGSSGLLTCLDAATGRIKWQQPHPPSGYQSPQDIFVIRGRVWCGSLNSKPGEFDTRYPDVAPSTGEFTSYDLETGEPGRTIPRGAECYWFHHRCHRAKATERFFLTSRTGIEMIDRATGRWHLHHWVRGACLYGIMPANGLVYAPPHPCACYPEAKLSWFNALAARRTPGVEPAEADRLQQGPAFGSTSAEPSEHPPVAANSSAEPVEPPPADASIEAEPFEQPPAAEWPTFRGNMARSGSVDTAVEAEGLAVKWRSEIGTKLSQPVVAGGRVFVAAVDAHTVYALDQESGRIEWNYTAGARIDSPPTLHQGMVIFGSADGWVYCLRAADGVLFWRFLAAPCDRRLMVRDQLESVWPMHGSVLIRHGVAYVIAGRSMFLDGGLTLYRLKPATGEVLSKVEMHAKDPNTGKDFHAFVRVLDMPVALSDILSSEGDYIFMRSQPFDLRGRRARVAHVPIGEQRGEEAHLFVPNGFLDDNYWHRAFWVYGRSVQGGPGYAATGRCAPAGKLMVLDEENVYVFGRRQEYWRWTVPMEYRLFCVDRSLPPPQRNSPASPPRRGPQSPFAVRWSVEVPILARAMVKAQDVLFVCGPADVADEPAAVRRPEQALEQLRRQAELFAGRGGSELWAVSARDGTTIHHAGLDAAPVFDGMAAAAGRLFLAAVDGSVICLE